MAEGYTPITTQIYDSGSKYLDDDSTFGVKDSLIMTFVERKGDPQADWELRFDISMIPLA